MHISIRYHEKDKKFPVKQDDGSDIIVDEIDIPLRAYLEIIKKWSELAIEHNDLERKVRGLVDSCTTSGRLIEIWPKGKKLVEEVTETYCVSVGKSDGKSLIPLTTEIDEKIF